MWVLVGFCLFVKSARPPALGSVTYVESTRVTVSWSREEIARDARLPPANYSEGSRAVIRLHGLGPPHLGWLATL